MSRARKTEEEKALKKEQRKQYMREYAQKNRDKLAAYMNDYEKANRDRLVKYRDDYHKENAQKNRDRAKKYYYENKDIVARKAKSYRDANKEKVASQKRSYKQTANKQRRNAYADNPLYAISCRLRTRTAKAFREHGYKRTTKTAETLGAEWETVRNHIESQFTNGMSWENKSLWHIDHIIPLASAKTGRIDRPLPFQQPSTTLGRRQPEEVGHPAA